MNALRALGVQISQNQMGTTVVSSGYQHFTEPRGVIDCCNSGTTARLLAGVLAPSAFTTVLTGDDSLRGRPMGRVVTPLRALGANIFGRADATLLPMCIAPHPVHAPHARTPHTRTPHARTPHARTPHTSVSGATTILRGEVPSAQVKSAILLAGIQLEGKTVYEEPVGHGSRDHTERMLPIYGADVAISAGSSGSSGASANAGGASASASADLRVITVSGGTPLVGTGVHIPGDISSASFFIGAVFLWSGSSIKVQGVGLNPTRIGFLDVLVRMGADLSYEIVGDSLEPSGFIDVEHCELSGVDVSPLEVASMVDEIPLLMMLSVVASSPITIRGIGELRLKESDRIKAMTSNLAKVGVESEFFYDGADSSDSVCESVVLHPRLSGGDSLDLPSSTTIVLESYHDHRIAMVNILLAKYFHNNIAVDDITPLDVSFPGFLQKLSTLEFS